MEIFEQYFNKQLDYSYYKYTTEKYIDKLGVDSVVLNKESMPYYIYEILEEEPDDLYLPVYQKDMERHRFLDSEAITVSILKNIWQHCIHLNLQLLDKEQKSYGKMKRVNTKVYL